MWLGIKLSPWRNHDNRAGLPRCQRQALITEKPNRVPSLFKSLYESTASSEWRLFHTVLTAERRASVQVSEIRSRESRMLPSTLRKETVQQRGDTSVTERRDVYLLHETSGVEIGLVVSLREQPSEIGSECPSIDDKSSRVLQETSCSRCSQLPHT